MIVDIKKGGFAKGLIEYHELKVQKGRGVRLMDTTVSQNKEQRIARIIDTANKNSSKKLKNKFAHISISFAKGETLAPETQMRIAEKYLYEMGYWNCPRILYEHHDTTHRHFHIVTTTVDLEGKKINDFMDHKRSQDLSRSLEKEFGLQVTEYTKAESAKLQEINARKFRIVKGLEKLTNNPLAQAEIQKVLTDEQQSKILDEKSSDRDISSLLKLRDTETDRIGQLYRIIRQFDAEYKTDKEALRERLNYIKQLSKSREEFMSNIQKQGLYVRKIAQSDNVHTLTYGIPETNFYVNERDLPIALRYDYLFTDKKVTLAFDPEAQKRFLKTMVSKSLRSSSSLEQFEMSLQKSGINYEYAINKRGIYGVSFSSSNLRDAIEFKGSEIGISWNKISKDLSIKSTQLDSNSLKTEKEFSKDTPVYIPKSLSKSLDTSNDDEEKKRKRKDRDQEMDRE